MTTNRSLPISCLLAILATLTPRALSATSPATRPDLSTPQGQLAAWQDDFEQWTTDQAMDAYAAHNDAERGVARAFAEQAVLSSQLVKLTRQRWGAEAEQSIAHALATDTRQDDAAAQITIDRDHAVIKIKNDAIADLLLVKEEGHWKIDVAAYAQYYGPSFPENVRLGTLSIPLIQKDLADMTAGKFTTPDQLVALLTRQLDPKNLGH